MAVIKVSRKNESTDSSGTIAVDVTLQTGGAAAADEKAILLEIARALVEVKYRLRASLHQPATDSTPEPKNVPLIV